MWRYNKKMYWRLPRRPRRSKTDDASSVFFIHNYYAPKIHWKRLWRNQFSKKISQRWCTVDHKEDGTGLVNRHRPADPHSTQNLKINSSVPFWPYLTKREGHQRKNIINSLEFCAAQSQKLQGQRVCPEGFSMCWKPQNPEGWSWHYTCMMNLIFGATS